MKRLHALFLRGNLLLVAFALFVSCNNNSAITKTGLTGNPENPVTDPDDPNADQWRQNSGNMTAYSSLYSNMLRFKTHQTVDRQGTGLNAFHFIIPYDWSVRDSLYWVYQDATLPIRYAAVCESPDRSNQVQIYADYRTVWSQGLMGTQGEQPPQNIIAGLKMAISKLRRGLNVRYTDQKIIPAVAAPGQRQGNLFSRNYSERGYVVFEYEQDGKTKEEIFMAKLDRSAMYGDGENRPSSIIWIMDEAMSCSANKGDLEFSKKVGLTMRSTARMNLPFYNKFVQVVQLLSDQYYQRIFAAGQISKIISQTNDQVLATISNSYWNTQRSYDRINQQFSNTIRGVESYNDGNGLHMQLPSGFDGAWYNKVTGEYVISNNAGFDPARTITGPGSWDVLQKE